MIAALAALLLASAPVGPVGGAWEPCLAGGYDGSAPEVAARLDLGPDRRFRYELTYGALDEAATGTWRWADGAVLLTSDPVTPPRFVLAEPGVADLARAGRRIALDLPRGLPPQYFSAVVTLDDGRRIARRFDDQGVLPLEAGERPVALVVTLAVFDVSSERLELSGDGEARIRFEPNDLGLVAFRDARLALEGETLTLDRHDRSLRFARVSGCGRGRR